MHRILLTLLSISMLSTAFSQSSVDTFKYTLSSSSSNSYIPLNNYSSVYNGKVWWDEEDIKIPIPFNFFAYNSKIDTLFCKSGGTPDFLTSAFDNEICPLDTHYTTLYFLYESIDRGYGTSQSESDVRYKLEGNTGNRILKIEYVNIGSGEEEDANEPLNSYVNVQLWLYEGSNIIEYRFGDIFIEDTSLVLGARSIPIGILSCGKVRIPNGGEEYQSQLYTLTGNPNNPNLNYIQNNFDYFDMDSLPPNGIVYRFTPEKSVSIKNTYSEKLLISPNPAHSEINIKSNDQSPIQLYDVRGSLIKVWDANAIKDVSDLPTGMYIVVQGNKRAKFSKN
jgi:hypothetical protein